MVDGIKLVYAVVRDCPALGDDDLLPTGQEALVFSAFPSWLRRITCGRCSKDRMLSETPRRDLPLREIINHAS